MGKIIETYTVEEIAKALKLHPYTIRRLCRERKIPAFSTMGGSASGRKFGGQCLSRAESRERFDAKEIEAWSCVKTYYTRERK